MELENIILREELFNKNSSYYNVIEKFKSYPLKMVYKGILPKLIRKKIEKISDYYQQNYVEKCWDEVIDYYLKHEKDLKFSKMIRPKKELNSKKIIWQYWGTGWNQEELPLIVKMCMKSLDEYKDDYIIIRLDDNNIEEYIELPDFINYKKKNGIIPFVFFADVLRLALLSIYGGIWIDATVLLTDKIDQKYLKMNYFMFQRTQNTDNKKYWSKLNNDYFSWNRSHKVNVLSSVMFSEKNNNVITRLLDLMLIFWCKKNKVPHYFFLQILYNSLINNYMLNEKCEIIDDTLPHILFSKFNEEYSKEELERLKKQINIHKLTHKLDYNNINIKETYYDYFIKKYKL